jgi:thiosulfate/3-mercaptopyruvate sulfurtransferase
MNKLKISLLAVLTVTLIVFACQGVSSQKNTEPWTSQQLIEPVDLAKTLTDSKSPQPIVFSIGPYAIIKNSIEIGPTMEKKNLQKLKEQLSKLPKDANIVIYCGCCPFGNCPNIRPAFKLLNDMGFKNHKLLNLSRNVKVDWIDFGYPINN